MSRDVAGEEILSVQNERKDETPNFCVGLAVAVIGWNLGMLLRCVALCCVRLAVDVIGGRDESIKSVFGSNSEKYF